MKSDGFAMPTLEVGEAFGNLREVSKSIVDASAPSLRLECLKLALQNPECRSELLMAYAYANFVLYGTVPDKSD